MSAEQQQDAWSPSEVRLIGLMAIALVFLWKAQFVLRRYFYGQDIVNLDLARRSGFGWHYLTLVSGGQLSPGLRAVSWVLARVSLYNWPVGGGILVLFAGCTALAAFRLLRTLLGDEPAVMVPLIVYLLSPLVVPDLGGWWTAMQSLPLQLATFLALGSHLSYVRSGRERDLASAVAWMAFGLLFTAKAVVLPVLLFAITSAFLVDATSWRASAAQALRRYARAWRWYGVALVCYAVVYLGALSEASGRALSAFVSWPLLTGLAGGPWRWQVAGPGGLYAAAIPPGWLIWTAVLLVATTVLLSGWARPGARRAWLIFAGWIVLADAAPGLDVRDLSDVAPVLAVCLGLAFFPLAGQVAGANARRGRVVRSVGLVSVAIFIAGSIWSDQVYQDLTGGNPVVASYLSNAGHAVAQAARGTDVLDSPVPAPLVSPRFGLDRYQSAVIGSMKTGRLHWIDQLRGTIIKLMMFGPDGKLYPVFIDGVQSPRRAEPGLSACWPNVGGRVTVRFPRVTTAGDRTLQVNYIWNSAPATVRVRYGASASRIRLMPGLHNAYLPVLGRVRSFTIYADAHHLCVGGAEAGRPRAALENRAAGSWVRRPS